MIIPKLSPEHYEKDEKQRSVTLNDAGIEKIEELLRAENLIQGETLYDIHNISVVHHVNQALKAHVLFTRDVDYIVKNDKVIIIDEFTGRMMDGRRYSEGLHQALEAKEGVTVEMENQTLASITYQNFFRMYPKLSGMTGTAETEAPEFEEIYKLHTVVIPTNRPIARKDNDDEVYLTANEKYSAMIKQIKECQDRGQPVLVGTTSIEKSEMISQLLHAQKVKHQVLNARYHEQEAGIIADAGAPGSVTLATNMAGRGTDIKLGGNLEARIAHEIQGVTDEKEIKKIVDKATTEIKTLEEQVKAAGGLYVIGTERHESRRIDNQLRGRSGRQGDPGESKFYISLQDDLMRIFGSDRLDQMLRRLGVQEGEAISHAWISKALERAQQKVEARNFDIRKHLLRYDDVMNDQRKIIYEQRRELMQSSDISEMIDDMRGDVIETIVHRHIPHDSLIEQWDLEGLASEVHRVLGIIIDAKSWAHEEGIAEIEIINRIITATKDHMTAKEDKYGSAMMRAAEVNMVLRLLDKCWKDHLLTLDQLRQGINLRAYAQGNPLNEYKREAFVLFQGMLDALREETIGSLAHFEIDVPDINVLEQLLTPEPDFSGLEEQTPDWIDASQITEADVIDIKKPKRSRKATEGDDPDAWGRVQRNAACPCGSGKKFKHCHGAIDIAE